MADRSASLRLPRDPIGCADHGSEGDAMVLDLRKRPLVLVVEDEALILLDALGIVADAGFVPIEAKSADEAIEILENRDDVQAIFTDVNISGCMDGLKLVHVIRKRWPPIRIIVTSGRVAVEESQLPSGGLFFKKPYQSSEIARALRRLAAN
jgi:two-component system, response regulator PdtaR